MDHQDDPIFPDASHVNGTSVVGTTESTEMTEVDPPTADQPQRIDSGGLRPGFLSELASAMRATAERERETIAARVADDAAGHIEKVRARAAIETEELKRLAEEDVEHIQEWAKEEMERVRSEADQRIADRRSSLDDYLQQHDAIIEREIEGVDAAVAEYGTTLDRFFAELSEAGDPAAIVARAEALPPPPDLDQVRSNARASAVAMFAEPEAPTEPQAPAEPEAPAEPAQAATAIDAEPTADDASESVVAIDDANEGTGDDTADVAAEPAGPAAFSLPAAEVDATNGTGAGDGMSDIESPAAAVEDSTSSEGAEPVPVMDPAATADQTWPTPAPEPERETVAATLDHTSAAVRLLRSVAPWTAPNHVASENRSDPE